MSSATCIHGFPPDGCLICQTLREAPTATAGRSPAKVAPARPDAVLATPPSRPAKIPLSLKIGGLLLAMALVAIAVFWIIGIVFAALRLIELVAVAVVAGWAGWKLGVHHGRREARRQLRG